MSRRRASVTVSAGCSEAQARAPCQIVRTDADTAAGVTQNAAAGESGGNSDAACVAGPQRGLLQRLPRAPPARGLHQPVLLPGVLRQDPRVNDRAWRRLPDLHDDQIYGLCFHLVRQTLRLKLLLARASARAQALFSPRETSTRTTSSAPRCAAMSLTSNFQGSPVNLSAAPSSCNAR